MAEFKMPSLGSDMEAGTLVEWLIKPGDTVKRGTIVAVVETQKGAIEVETFEAGVVEQILVPVGEKVPVGTVLALIRSEGEAAAAPSPAPVPVPKRPQPPAPVVMPGRARISPAARKRAGELGVDLADLSGTGPDGAVTLEDVERAAQAAKLQPPTAAERHAAMRQAIGAAMARSKREIPHYYLGTTIDMSRAMAWLQTENARRPITERLLHAVLLIKAVALAVRQVAELNGFWIDGEFRPSQEVHIGMGISLRGGGLVAPALHHADTRSLDELMAGLRDLVQRARTGSLRSSELSDATLTITHLGEQGVDTVYGIIYPPRVALVGFGRVLERPWSVNGRIESRPLLQATLAADHRASNGHRGGLFLTVLDRLLQEPGKL
jgi:pyruvate dehydrogenase E2 component (dihydrolipoamide acetyltransferase)